MIIEKPVPALDGLTSHRLRFGVFPLSGQLFGKEYPCLDQVRMVFAQWLLVLYGFAEKFFGFAVLALVRIYDPQSDKRIAEPGVLIA